MAIDEIISGVKDFVDGSSVIGDAISRKKQQSPQYDFLWRVEMPVLSQSTGQMQAPKAEDSEDDGMFGGFLSQISTTMNDVPPIDINHRIMNFDSPFFRFDTKRITDKNGFFYTASNREIGTISMTIHEMEDGNTLKYLINWRDAILNPDGTYNAPIYYKFPIKFYRLSATKLDLHSYTYDGFFITEISPVSNSYEGNGLTSYAVTFTGDRVKYDFMSGAEVRSKVMAKELSIIGKQWVKNKTRVTGGGLTDILRTAGGLSDLIQ